MIHQLKSVIGFAKGVVIKLSVDQIVFAIFYYLIFGTIWSYYGIRVYYCLRRMQYETKLGLLDFWTIILNSVFCIVGLLTLRFFYITYSKVVTQEGFDEVVEKNIGFIIEPLLAKDKKIFSLNK